MTGQEAMDAWNKASALVKAGKIDEARRVVLYLSDTIALEKLIEKQMASCANTVKEK